MVVALTENPVDWVLMAAFGAPVVLALVGLLVTAAEELLRRERRARR